jgi:tetratricopeptide (TPR) repeat protein
MLNQQKEPLFSLIKSLSKSEKRHFKLFVGRLGKNSTSKYLTLFNFLDQSTAYREQQIIKKGIVSKAQLSNLKANLYKQILKSLRLNPIHQNIRNVLREQLDYATILYNKGLYQQSLKILDKAKSLAIENEEKNIAYEILEIEKVIESQFITRSTENRADTLAIQGKDLSKLNLIASKLSNLSLQLYSYLLRKGYVKNEQEYQEVTSYFNDRMPEFDIETLGFREKLWLYKAKLWYSFLIQDFLNCYKYSSKWVNLFDKNPNMIHVNPVSYLKGNNYLLESSFYIKHKTQFTKTLTELEKNIASGLVLQNGNTEILSFIHLYTSKVNLHFLDGRFEEGEYLVAKINKGIKKYGSKIDQHHIMLFYYKIACLYFGMGKNRECIAYLAKIIKSKSLTIGEDLMCFSRILNLVVHFEAGLDDNLELQIKNTYRFLLKIDNLQKVQKEMLKFLRDLTTIYPNEIHFAFKKLHKSLKQYENHPYEKRAFLYLDIVSWLESRIEDKPVAQIIQEKATKAMR